MNSFVEIDCINFRNELKILPNYQINYLYENCVDGSIFVVYFNLHKLDVMFNMREKCFIILPINLSFKFKKTKSFNLFSLKETLRMTQEQIYYLSRYDKLKSFL